MRVRIFRQGIVVDNQAQLELERALLAHLGRYRDTIERVTLRLGESRAGQPPKTVYHCRATAQLLDGKTVWADRSHQLLGSAADASLAHLSEVVDESLRRGTSEFPALGADDSRALMGEGWALLAPL